jgi:hypothetical protein
MERFRTWPILAIGLRLYGVRNHRLGRDWKWWVSTASAAREQKWWARRATFNTHIRICVSRLGCERAHRTNGETASHWVFSSFDSD